MTVFADDVLLNAVMYDNDICIKHLKDDLNRLL